MGKTVNKIVKNAVGATIDVATGGLTTDRGRQVAGDVLQTAGLATPDSLKRPYQQPQQTYQQPAHQAAPQQFINGQGVTPQANPNNFGQPSSSFAAPAPAPQASSGIQGSSIVVDDLPF